MIKTITTIPPIIQQTFNRWLLIPWEAIMHEYHKRKTKWSKKIRPQDMSRRKKFEELTIELFELYERAKIKQKS